MKRPKLIKKDYELAADIATALCGCGLALLILL